MNVLTKYAKQDINLAKREGRVAVCGTKAGNVEIEFSGGLFTFKNFNTGETLSGQLNQAEAILKLASLYVVEGA